MMIFLKEHASIQLVINNTLVRKYNAPSSDYFGYETIEWAQSSRLLSLESLLIEILQPL